MSKRFNREDIIRLGAALFVALEVALFPLIQLTPADVSAFSSYLAIVLVAAFALLTCNGNRKSYLVRLGILLTLVADYFLVLSDDAELQGVISFIFVQLAYFAYLFLREERRGVRLTNAVARIALSAVLVIIAFSVLGEDTDALSLVSVIYYANLLTNIVFAFVLGKSERVFAVGLVLFALCDLCIGLDVLLSSYLDSNALEFFYGAHINLPWVFYQPSQVLIAWRLCMKEK